MTLVIKTNAPPCVRDKELHDHKSDRSIDIPGRGGLIDRYCQRCNDHHLPQRHQPGAKAPVAMKIVIQTAIQPTPENENEQAGILPKAIYAHVHSQMMSDPRNGDDVDQVIKKFQPQRITWIWKILMSHQFMKTP